MYDEAVRQALIVFWEAGDRVCGKRLKTLIPILVVAMERHGHLQLHADVRARLMQISAATIDRTLAATRASIDGQRKRRTGVGAAIRRSVPVRTFADWRDPPPGFFEVDMVEHCGGSKMGGDFVHTLTLTDIASGWTECVAMPVRNQALIVEALSIVDVSRAAARGQGELDRLPEHAGCRTSLRHARRGHRQRQRLHEPDRLRLLPGVWPGADALACIPQE